MSKRTHVAQTLRTLLVSAPAGKPPPDLLAQFVKQCSAIALTLIQSKIVARSISPHKFGLSPSDIAFDAISDLFGQNEDGRLVQIAAYFEGIDWEMMGDEELLIHVRRLVFARTNQGLFRMFQEIDPGLGKILRNTKLAIAALKSFDERDFFGEPCIAPSLCDPLPRLPMIDRDCLERRLLDLTTGNERIPEILAKLSRYLRTQEEHSRMVPVLWVAYGIRAVYARVESQEHEGPDVEATLAEADTRATLTNVCRLVKEQNWPRNVLTNGMSAEVYERYFNVIEQILIKRLVTNDGRNVSLFRQLQALMPDMTREEYNAKHKSRIEYLARLAEKKAVEILRKDFS